MINMKDKFMCISIREDGYGIFSNGGWASYNKEGKITGICGDINSFPASLSISIAGKKECDTDKTLEQRVADLESQVVHEPQATAVFKGVLNIKDNQVFMREASIDKAWLDGVTPNCTFSAHSITHDIDTVTAYVDVNDSMLPLMSLFSLKVTMERNDELSLAQYESAAIRQAKTLIIGIAKEAAL
ncbi:hypothetical protein Q4R10_20015 [Morganella morganii]